MKIRHIVLTLVTALILAGCYTVAVEPNPEPVPYVYYYPDGYYYGNVYFAPGYYRGYHPGRRWTRIPPGYRARSAPYAGPRSYSRVERYHGHRR